MRLLLYWAFGAAFLTAVLGLVVAVRNAVAWLVEVGVAEEVSWTVIGIVVVSGVFALFWNALDEVFG